jgi:hypothetical protein
VGGYGSGRWSGYTKKETVEDCLVLVAGKLACDGLLRAGVRTLGGTLRWTNTQTGEEVSSIGYELDTVTGGRGSDPRENLQRGGSAHEPGDWTLRLHYRQSRTGEVLDYPIALETTRPNFGGLRWWFTCPRSKGGTTCGRRAAKLYLPPGGRSFGCRTCYALTYTSAQESRKWDSLARFMAKDSGLPLSAFRSFLNEKS